MPQTHGTSKLFWHRIRLQKDAPLRHDYPTYEYDHPFRYGVGHVLRVPKTRFGVVVGRWQGELPEEVAAKLAIEGQELDHFEAVGETVQDQIRRKGWVVR